MFLKEQITKCQRIYSNFFRNVLKVDAHFHKAIFLHDSIFLASSIFAIFIHYCSDLTFLFSAMNASVQQSPKSRQSMSDDIGRSLEVTFLPLLKQTRILHKKFVPK